MQSTTRGRREDEGATGRALDVVGIGMLNLDYIASASSHRRRDPDAILEITERFEHGAESVVDEETILDVIEQLGGRETLSPSLGGSAFLAIHALANMDVGLRLGYVGLSGRSPDPTLSPLKLMDRLGVDRSAVRVDREGTCGMCVSYIHDGERTLLTCPGANARFARYADEHMDDLAAYLARSRFIHVTAFLDPESPSRVVALIERARRLNPDVRVSFDPGHAWCVQRPPEAMRLLALTDYLFVNHREFRALANLGGIVPDDQVIAEEVLRSCGRSCSALVLKRYDRIMLYRCRGEDVVREDYEHEPLGPDIIEDATGAGDVFAAGMLAAMSSDHLQLELGTLLGMQMARQKLHSVGDRAYAQFSPLARRFLRGWGAEQEVRHRPRGVFVAHGMSPLWRSVRDYLRDDLGLDVHHFEETAHDSEEITGALDDYLRRCSFAVCLLTNEDRMAGGTSRARQNVIHEAGLFQGRYGFRRAALLVEDGCEVPSNVGGLIRHGFNGAHIEQAFTSLARHLRRENVVPDGRRPLRPSA
jgi:sugar/nucleoside kinase (ribokinase family)